MICRVGWAGCCAGGCCTAGCCAAGGCVGLVAALVTLMRPLLWRPWMAEKREVAGAWAELDAAVWLDDRA
jgi:hypothetical protein